MFKRYVYRNYRVFVSLKEWVGRRVTLTGWMLLAGVMMTGALGLDTSLSVAYQPFAFLFCLVLAAALAVCWNRRGLEVERRLPRFGSAGETFTYRLRVRNPGRGPLKAVSLLEELTDPRPSLAEFVSTPEPGEEKRNWFDRTYAYYRFTWLMARKTLARVQEQPIPDLAPGAVREIEAELTPLRRGVLRLSGVTVASPDPFGLFRSLRRAPLAQSVLILPKRYPLAPFELPGAMKYQQGGVNLAGSVGESEEFVSLREYRPGDPLRRMHWKSFAKMGRPIVKEFQEEFFVRHALALDTFSSLAYNELFEEAVSVAASLAFTLQDHDSLLDLMFVGPEAYCFTSGRGVAHTEQMLEILASVQVCRDKPFRTLENLVLNHAGQISGCICVLLDWDAPRQELAQKLRMLGVPLLVFVIVPTETRLEPGPMASQPDKLHALPLGGIAQKLAGLALRK